MPMNTPTPENSNPEPVANRWTLIRDMVAFQFKLVVDGFRDFILIPSSLVAGLLSLIKGNPRQDNDFYELMRLGQRSEHWINLFGAAKPIEGSRASEVRLPTGDLDQALAKLEDFVVHEANAGGLTTQTRQQLENLLDRLESKSKGTSRPATGSTDEASSKKT